MLRLGVVCLSQAGELLLQVLSALTYILASPYQTIQIFAFNSFNLLDKSPGYF